jgi:hypothetical protein
MWASSDLPTVEISDSYQAHIVAKPEEQLLYENVKQKSHYLSLRDQLKFLLKPDLRSTHESILVSKLQILAISFSALKLARHTRFDCC